jgi:hypothetical protein
LLASQVGSRVRAGEQPDTIAICAISKYVHATDRIGTDLTKIPGNPRQLPLLTHDKPRTSIALRQCKYTGQLYQPPANADRRVSTRNRRQNGPF